MSPPADLETIQRQVWKLITAPEGVVKGARDLASAGEIESAELSTLVRGDERLRAEDRLDIYANMYFYRLRDCLAEDFPKTSAVAGGARFHNLVTDYLLAHPSSSWTLRRLGDRFPGFIGRHAIGGEIPFLADLARLEWARIEVFDARDSVPLGRDAIGRMQENSSLRLGLLPAALLLDLDWSIAPVWRQIDDDAPGPGKGESNSAAVEGSACAHFEPPRQVKSPERKRSHALVWRAGFAVYHRTVPEDEHACLREIRDRGATLPRLCELALESIVPARTRTPGEVSSDASRRMADLVGRWLQDGLLIEAPPA